MFNLILILIYSFFTQAAPLPLSNEKLSDSFRFHLKTEPHSLDPAKAVSGESNYLLENIFRGLTRYTSDQRLVFDLAEKCSYKPELIVICHLRPDARWSDGSAILAKDFVASFKHLLSPQAEFAHANLLFSIKNARAVYAGEKNPSELGLTAAGDRDLRFQLEKNDNEFFEKLSNPLLAVFKEDSDDPRKSLYSGPYKIQNWFKGKKIVLTSNDYYKKPLLPRPNVEIYFAADDSTALTLYEKGILNFLWRLPTSYIPEYQNRPDFFQKRVDRFDYIGFSLKEGSVFRDKNVRHAFAQALDFEAFKKLFFALGAPGCPGLGESLIDQDPSHCVAYSPESPHLALGKIKFWYSKLGGDDITKSAEWFQEQWHKNLGVNVDIRGLEQKTYLSFLKRETPDAFRKGVGLSRPTCLAAIEIFRKDNPENFIGFSNARFENLANALEQRKMQPTEKKSICGVASDLLFKEEYVGIPLGRIHFTMLAKSDYQGWTLNELNQLNLAELHQQHPSLPFSQRK